MWDWSAAFNFFPSLGVRHISAQDSPLGGERTKRRGRTPARREPDLLDQPSGAVRRREPGRVVLRVRLRGKVCVGVVAMPTRRDRAGLRCMSALVSAKSDTNERRTAFDARKFGSPAVMAKPAGKAVTGWGSYGFTRRKYMLSGDPGWLVQRVRLSRARKVGTHISVLTCCTGVKLPFTQLKYTCGTE